MVFPPPPLLRALALGAGNGALLVDRLGVAAVVTGTPLLQLANRLRATVSDQSVTALRAGL
jgi:hypothetical protein